MTGAELAALRKAAGLSQTDLAQRAGIGRHAVSYWETKPAIDLSARAVRCIAKILPLPAPPPVPDMLSAILAAVQAERVKRAELAARQFLLKILGISKPVKRRVPCGATNRKGEPCRLKSEPGMRRCRFHGGKSTGPRTPEGRARISAANRLRWERWRLAKEIEAGDKATGT